MRKLAKARCCSRTRRPFTPTIFAGATFEFGLYGTNSDGDHIGLIGQMSFDSFAATATGLLDSNDPAAPQSAQALSVTMLTKPDPTTGRGTMNLSAGALNLTLVYYIVNSNKLLLMDDDSTASVPRVAGYLTRQGYLTGAAPPFTNEALGSSSPAVFSLAGISGSVLPTAVLGLGRLAGAWPASPGDTLNGTLNVQLDETVQAVNEIGEFFPGAAYSVAANGRAVLSFADALTSSTRQFVIYLDDVSDGYIIENGSSQWQRRPALCPDPAALPQHDRRRLHWGLTVPALGRSALAAAADRIDRRRRRLRIRQRSVRD
jgi:hypothetical protein